MVTGCRLHRLHSVTKRRAGTAEWISSRARGEPPRAREGWKECHGGAKCDIITGRMRAMESRAYRIILGFWIGMTVQTIAHDLARDRLWVITAVTLLAGGITVAYIIVAIVRDRPVDVGLKDDDS